MRWEDQVCVMSRKVCVFKKEVILDSGQKRMIRFLTGREMGGKGRIKRRNISIRGNRVKYSPYSYFTTMRHQADILAINFWGMEKIQKDLLQETSILCLE